MLSTVNNFKTSLSLQLCTPDNCNPRACIPLGLGRVYIVIYIIRNAIYFRSIDTASELYSQFFKCLGKAMWHPNEEESSDNRVVEIYHAHLDADALETVPAKLKDTKSALRCVISTIALGMGIQVSNVDAVIHWGPTNTLLEYWQEVGRCARDGRDGRACMYIPARSLSGEMDAATKELVQCATCVRKHVLKSLQTKGMEDAEIDACCGGQRCCNWCDGQRPETE